MENIKRVLSIIIIICLIGLCIYKLGYLFRPTDTDGAYSQIETFHSLPENTVEVIIYGSSHAFRGISTMELYDKYGIGAYNYGWNWQACNTTNLFLKDSLKKQTPKVVLIEAYNLCTVLNNQNMDAQIYYSRYIYDKTAKTEYIKQCFGSEKDRYIAYYLPICAFHDNWNTLTAASFNDLGMGTFLRKNMGFSASDKVTEVEIPDYKTFGQIEFNEMAIKEMSDMVETCHNKDIDVVFYTVPWQGEYKYSDAMKKFADENDCEYYDLFEMAELVGLNGKTDFSDGGHLNTSGSVKVADFLGKILVDNYDLTDMRNIEGNLWETAKKMEY